MAKTETPIAAIAKDLGFQISLCEDSLKESARTMAMLNIDAREYRQEWESRASVSSALMQFKALEACIESKDEKKTENFLRYTVHRIRQNEGEPGADMVANGMRIIFDAFNYYLTYFEE